MIQSLSAVALHHYVQKQLDFLCPDGREVSCLRDFIEPALTRLDTALSSTTCKYFWQGDETRFDHLHSDQYAMFLYLLSNTAFRNEAPRAVCDKLFVLNKALHSLDVYYEVELPPVFVFSHAVGTVLGRATYSNYLLVQQNCTVGGARQPRNGEPVVYPKLGAYLSLYAGSSILGDCVIGDRCKIAANSVVIDTSVPDDTLYAGSRGHFVLKPHRGVDCIWKA